MLIVYSVIAQLSPLRLFAAAIFPGLVSSWSYILVMQFLELGLIPQLHQNLKQKIYHHEQKF